jgi:hypothetical protein
MNKRKREEYDQQNSEVPQDRDEEFSKIRRTNDHPTCDSSDEEEYVEEEEEEEDEDEDEEEHSSDVDFIVSDDDHVSDGDSDYSADSDQEEDECEEGPEAETQTTVVDILHMQNKKNFPSDDKDPDIHIGNIVRGKRTRKAVERYQDKHYIERMTCDVSERELEKIIVDEDDCSTGVRSEGESLSESEEGYNTEDYETRDNTRLASEDSDPDEHTPIPKDSGSTTPLVNFLIRKPAPVPSTKYNSLKNILTNLSKTSEVAVQSQSSQ